jgi:hypothetical protein
MWTLEQIFNYQKLIDTIVPQVQRQGRAIYRPLSLVASR